MLIQGSCTGDQQEEVQHHTGHQTQRELRVRLCWTGKGCKVMSSQCCCCGTLLSTSLAHVQYIFQLRPYGFLPAIAGVHRVHSSKERSCSLFRSDFMRQFNQTLGTLRSAFSIPSSLSHGPSGNMKRDTLTKSRTQAHGHSKLLLLASERVRYCSCPLKSGFVVELHDSFTDFGHRQRQS